MAQAVYSVNIVGYVNVTVPANDFAIIANPLNGAVNTLAALLPSVPENTLLYRYSQVTGFSIASFIQDDFGNLNWGGNANDVLAPGEGAFIKNPTGSPLTLTFVGEVLTGTQANPIPTGFSLKASKVPLSAGMTPAGLQYNPTESDTVYLYRGGYQIYNYIQDDFGNLNWDPSVPTPNVGEGFWLNAAAAKTWSITFNP
jgi:hypothetical protein